MAERRRGGAPKGNLNAMKVGTHSRALQQARVLVAADNDGAMPVMPLSRSAWARLFDVNPRAVGMAEIRMARDLAQQEGLGFNGLTSLGPIARQRLALLCLLKRGTQAGIIYAHYLYQSGSESFFEHVRRLMSDEARIAKLEQRVIEDLAIAAGKRT